MLRMFVLGIAGGVGTLARYWLSGLAQRWSRGAFPLGTLTVNVVGCLLIGLVMELVREQRTLSPDARTLVTVGLIGGFTTFSAFSYETLDLAAAGSRGLAIANVAANVIVGTGAVWLGAVAARSIFGRVVI